MNPLAEKPNHILIVIYSAIFFILIETILLKTSLQLFFFLSYFPIVLLSLILRPIHLISSLLISMSILLSIQKFDWILSIHPKNLFFLLIISLIPTTFSILNQRKINSDISSGEIFSVFISIVVIGLIMFIFFYYQNLDHIEIANLVSNLLSSLQQKPINNGNLNFKEISDLIVMILPAMNTFIILTIFMFNFKLSTISCDFLNLKPLFTYDVEDFYSPKWIAVIFFLNLFVLFLNISPLNIYLVNSLMILSIPYLVEGYKILHLNLKKLSFNPFLKFIILFLLFIFLGYVLLLLIFIAGMYTNIKKNFFKE